MSEHLLRLGTRGSKLALWQAEWVKGLLEGTHPGLEVEIVIIVSSGDQDRTRPLEQLGGEGLFTRELEQRLESNEIDLAVHSLKDLPTKLPQGFHLAAVPPRGAVEDALVTREGGELDRLAPGATVATGSPRRKAQLLHLRPDLNVVGIRGNVPTRLRKLETENLDGTILARAGLERLGFAGRISQIFPVDIYSPAVGQGAVGVEVREEDKGSITLIQAIDHAPTHLAVDAERGFLSGLGGGCQLPVGAHAYVDDTAEPAFLNLAGRVINRQGSEHLRADMTGPLDRAWELGERLAALLIAQGATELLAEEN
jgi:hydroxymethylbilane synthase